MTETEPKRTPANQNPWYVLMTLYGEQTGDSFDAALHEKNREAWNSWAGQALPGELRELHMKSGASLPASGEWEKNSNAVCAQHKAEMLRRNGSDFTYPGFPKPPNIVEIDLSKVNFGNPVFAFGFVFPSPTNFGESKFCGYANFNMTTFVDRVWFHHAKFLKEAYFEFANFVSDTRFHRVVFGGYASFDTSSFQKGATFDATEFRGGAEFKLAQVRGPISFSSACFKGQASFSPVAFFDQVYFNEAVFEGEAYFGQTFERDANFDGASFRNQVWFSSVVFFNEAIFSRATFAGDVTFSSTSFRGAARFDATLFSGSIKFESALFANSTWFTTAVFDGFIYFSKAEFGTPGQNHPVTFADCQFLKPTNFRDAVFHSQYPDLSGAVLHDKTEFTAKPEAWPLTTTQPAEEAKASCARIRHAIAKQGLPEEEHFFYRREMGFACQIGPVWQRLPYQIFKLLSDFGYSIQRPVEALSLLWVCPAVLFFCHAQTGRLADYPEIGRALALSFANIFYFLGFHRTFFTPDVVQRLPAALQVLSGFQTLAGVALLFFLGLGLRTRFRLR